mmetsp:Transcript_13026/g.28333  ORF Transcript_13026/g.28333 Transcript_13026/m.28333 type:complete len:96 (-) Transcript_13026:158-445(-)
MEWVLQTLAYVGGVEGGAGAGGDERRWMEAQERAAAVNTERNKLMARKMARKDAALKNTNAEDASALQRRSTNESDCSRSSAGSVAKFVRFAECL